MKRILAAIIIVASYMVILPAASATTTPSSGNLYWVDETPSGNNIGKASLDGTNVVQNFISGPQGNGGFDGGISIQGDYIYWTAGSSVVRARKDGTGTRETLVTTTGAAYSVATDSTYLYWDHDGVNNEGAIGRSLLDGSAPDDAFIPGTSVPPVRGNDNYGLFVTANHIYWANYTSNSIGRANIDGTNKNSSFISVPNSGGPCSIWLQGSYLYWTNYSNDNIGRANLDGSGIQNAFIDTGAGSIPYYVVSDDQYLYWSAASTIGRANLDGTNVDTSFITITSGGYPIGLWADGSAPGPVVPTTTAPTAPTSVVATATGKRSATVSFAAPASDGGSAVTSYTVTSSTGGTTKTLTQADGGAFTFDNLEPSTSYTFAVTATNAIGTSAAATSNSIKTLALDVASISALSFADDGTGTGGKIIWGGKNIDAVLFTGTASAYPGPYNYGAFTGGWNGRIRNLTPDTSYTISIYAVSADGVGESKSLTFKTSATLPALAGSTNSTISQAAQMATQLPKLYTWINENVFVDGEGDRMKTVLNKFDAVKVPAASAYMKLPNSTVLSASATSSTPTVCTVEGQVTVRSIAAGTCTISYTVSGASKALATLVKDFVFKKFAK